ncbi:C-C motif chemokine 13 [Polymixia lowei]
MARLTIYLSTMLVLLVAVISLGESSPMRFCCTAYNEDHVPIKRLRHYRIQEISEGCRIKAVVFRTVKNKLVCANPDSKWVQDGIKYLQSNAKH